MRNEPSPGTTVGMRGAIPSTRRRRFNQRKIAPYLFLSPMMLFFLIFFLIPVLFSLYIAFTRWNPLSSPRWVGLKNFEYILTRDHYFWPILQNTFEFALGVVILNTILSLVLAFIFTRSRGKAIWRSIYWLPMVTNVVAVAYMWMYLYDGVYGAVNQLLAFVGIVGPNWLSDPASAMPAVILVAVWVGIGGSMLIFSAGLEGIDESYYEASRVDGATTWQEFRHITLPLLRPTLLFVLVTGFIGALGNFALIMVMTDGGPVQSTNVVANYMYKIGFQDLRMGRASAMAYILFVIIFIFTMIQLRVFRRGGVESY